MYLSRLAVAGLRASATEELEVRLPGRFSVLVGANAAGKTTISDALYLAHPQSFPALPRTSSAALGPVPRYVDVEYRLESDPATEGALGTSISTNVYTPAGGVALAWRRRMHRYLGAVRLETEGSLPDQHKSVHLVYLPAWRNPIDELARRETQILLQLLRSQREAQAGVRDLTDLRVHASALLDSLAKDGLIAEVEERIAGHLSALSGGVSPQWAYVRGQVADDTYLARVLQFMLATMEGRENALPLDVSGLGYVNLLHIAITLAGIPDMAAAPLSAAPATGAAPSDSLMPPLVPQRQAGDGPDLEDEASLRRLQQASAERDSAEDAFYATGPLHVTVVIEEPEAHLHPQLQHALVRYLRHVTRTRPEIQIVISSHATDVITSCDPKHIVVVRRDASGRRVCRPVAHIPMPDGDRVLRMARLHLDSSRSTSLFAERLVLVEGVTQAAVVREFGYAWAAGDPRKTSFIDALSIVPMGTKVGEWSVTLLATRGHELCRKLAILRDSDQPFEQVPTVADWMTRYDPDIARMFLSHPTLEPSLTQGNTQQLAAALASLGQAVPAPITPETVEALFRSARAATATRAATSAGPFSKRKAEFALALAEQLVLALEAHVQVAVPGHLRQLFEFVYDGMAPPPQPAGEADVLAADGPTAAGAPPQIVLPEIPQWSIDGHGEGGA